MADVFISYSKKDAAFASLLVSALNSSAISCWYDQEINPDENWRERINAELQAARCCIVLWSQNSISSRFVVSEAERADIDGKLVQMAMERVDAPIGFSATQYHDFINWSGAIQEARWSKLVESVRRVLNGERTAAMKVGAVAGSSKASKAWLHVAESTDPAEYRSFINLYPDDPLTKFAKERLEDIARWQHVNKTDPKAIRAFLLDGPFDRLLMQAKAAIPAAEKYQRDAEAAHAAAVAQQQQAWQHQMATEAARQEKARKDEDLARRVEENARINAASRPKLFIITTLVSVPAFLIAATFVATQIESGVGMWASEAPTRALNVIEYWITFGFNIMTWGWPDELTGALIGTPFGEMFFMTTACALVGLIGVGIAFDNDWAGGYPTSSGLLYLLGWGGGLILLWVVAYLAAVVLPSILTTPLLWVINLLLLFVLAMWPLVQLVRAIVEARKGTKILPYGSIVAFALLAVSIAFTQTVFGIPG